MNVKEREKWPIRITAHHLMNNLGVDLYQTPGDCLYELVRNSIRACMPNNAWRSDHVHIEILLVDDHPLAPRTKTLIVLDHGSGFTDASIKEFCDLGPSLDRVKRQKTSSPHFNIAQKGIGRCAAYGLNELCQQDEQDTDTGFYILTRTRKTGPVRMVSMIPSEIERERGIPVDMVDENGAEMQHIAPLVKGAFSVIIIPNSTLKRYDDIRQALLWRIPRKPDMAMDIRVGGKKLIAPPLVTRITKSSERGDIEVYIDAVEDNTADGGIWFTDAKTGLRVVYAPKLGYQYLPDPFWHRKLIGDIFIPDLLKNQDTSRSGLNTRYLKSRAWKNVINYLSLHVKPLVEGLLDEENTFGRDKISQVVMDFIKQCAEVFGEPTLPAVVSTLAHGFDDGADIRDNKSRQSNGNRNGAQRHRRKHGEAAHERIKSYFIKIGERSYTLARRRLDPRILAEVDPISQNTIYINNDESYELMPKRKDARDEHVITQIIEAACQNQHPTDSYEMRLMKGEIRLQLIRRRSGNGYK